MRNLIRRLFLIPAIVLGLLRATRSSRGRSPRTRIEPEDLIGSISKRSFKRWTAELAAILVIIGAVGLLVAASGVIPIKASSGHWPVTRWFLEFSMARSVSFHARGISVPNDLTDPAKIMRGAGHYETGCRPCHGAPELRAPRITAALTPAPPYLPEEISHWEPEELFYIVKHGIKMTGMPAWPALERDDEVWSTVAFLLVFPELDRQAYDALVFGTSTDRTAGAPLDDLTGPDDIPVNLLRSCARCHGIDGLGRGEGAFPRLAAQKPQYLLNQLRAYAAGERHSGIMEPIAAGIDDHTMRALARYYGGLSHGPEPLSSTGGDLARGRAIALHGIPSRKVPSCVDCHRHDSKSAYPILHGQDAGYLQLQLELFSTEARGGSKYSNLMREFAHKLKKEEMRDVAAWFAAQPGGSLRAVESFSIRSASEDPRRESATPESGD